MSWGRPPQPGTVKLVVPEPLGLQMDTSGLQVSGLHALTEPITCCLVSSSRVGGRPKSPRVFTSCPRMRISSRWSCFSACYDADACRAGGARSRHTGREAWEPTAPRGPRWTCCDSVTVCPQQRKRHGLWDLPLRRKPTSWPEARQPRNPLILSPGPRRQVWEEESRSWAPSPSSMAVLRGFAWKLRKIALTLNSAVAKSW